MNIIIHRVLARLQQWLWSLQNWLVAYQNCARQRAIAWKSSMAPRRSEELATIQDAISKTAGAFLTSIKWRTRTRWTDCDGWCACLPRSTVLESCFWRVLQTFYIGLQTTTCCHRLFQRSRVTAHTLHGKQQASHCCSLANTRCIIIFTLPIPTYIGFPHEKSTSSKSAFEQRSMYTNL